MARIKHYNVVNLKRVFEESSGWFSNFSHKYGTDTMGAAIVGLGWNPTVANAAWKHPDYTIRRSWTPKQQADWDDGRNLDREQGLQKAQVAINQWFQDTYPDLAVRVLLEKDRIFIETVDAKQFGLAQQVAVRVDNTQEIRNLLQSIEV